MNDDGPTSGDVTTAGIPGNGGGTLFPFQAGDERTRTLARRGVAAHEAKRAVARADTQAVADHLRRVVSVHNRADLGAEAAACAADIIGRVSRGEIPIRHAGDASELLRVLVDVARLEAGESTTNAAVLHVGGDALERFRALQVEARSVLGVAALAAAGVVEVDGGDA